MAQRIERSGSLSKLQLGQIDALLEPGIVEFGHAGLDSIIKPIEPRLGLGDDGTLAVDLRFQLPTRIIAAVGHRLEDGEEPPGRKNLLLDGLQHQFINLVHADRVPAASSFGRAFRAGQVTVLPTLAGAQHHAASALLASGNAGEQRRASHHARWCLSRVAGPQGALDGIEGLVVDDGRHVHPDPFGWRPFLPGPAVDAIVVVDSDIGLVLENAFDRRRIEGFAPISITPGVEVRGDGLDSHGTAAFVAMQVKAEDPVDHSGLVVVDFENLLLLPPQDQRDAGSIAKGRRRTVPVTLFGVGHHHVTDHAGIDLGLVPVKGGQDCLHEFTVGTLRDILCRGDKAHAGLLELLLVVEILANVPEEPRKAVNDHQIDFVGGVTGELQHALEFWPAIGSSGQAWFDKSFDEGRVAKRAGRVDLPLLFFQRYQVICLPLGADTAVPDGSKPI